MHSAGSRFNAKQVPTRSLSPCFRRILNKYIRIGKNKGEESAKRCRIEGWKKEKSFFLSFARKQEKRQSEIRRLPSSLSLRVRHAKPPARLPLRGIITHLCEAPRSPVVAAAARGLLQHRRDAPPVAAVRSQRPQEDLVFHRRPRRARARVRAGAGLVRGTGPELGLGGGDQRFHQFMLACAGAGVKRGGRSFSKKKFFFFLSVAKRESDFLEKSSSGSPQNLAPVSCEGAERRYARGARGGGESAGFFFSSAGDAASFVAHF